MPSPFVVKLPPELLAAIFSYVTPRFEHTGPDCLLRWIRTTHVCHYWRDVAINHADLWTTVSVGPSRTSIESLYFDLCFKRSGSLPVALLCDVEDIGWIEEMLTTLVSLDVTRDKVKHLRIVGLESNIFSLFNLISRFALSTLDISTYTLDGPDEDIWLPHPPDHQFADLTTLSTAGCAFDLNSVLYGPHLTTLELRDLPTFQRLNTWQVLALIKRLPKITDLTLVDSLRSPGTLSPPTPVKTLRSLTIVDTGTPCLCLLAALIAPNLESFHVAYQSRLGSHDTLSEVLKYANGAIRSPLPLH
ncbi:hypothetical protein ONZ45_g7015 [Pleurotus djamor]|nr:hypothetical protein ONZ45_g7015 [Pleurotus djamor]